MGLEEWNFGRGYFVQGFHFETTHPKYLSSIQLQLEFGGRRSSLEVEYWNICKWTFMHFTFNNPRLWKSQVWRSCGPFTNQVTPHVPVYVPWHWLLSHSRTAEAYWGRAPSCWKCKLYALSSIAQFSFTWFSKNWTIEGYIAFSKKGQLLLPS